MNKQKNSRIKIFATLVPSLLMLAQSNHLIADDGAAKERISIDRAVELSIENNVAIKAQELNYQKSLLKINESESNRNPSTDLEFGYRYTDNATAVSDDVSNDPAATGVGANIYSAKVNVETGIFERPVNNRLVKISKLEVELANLELQIVKKNEIHEALELYYTALLNQKLLGSAAAQTKTSEIHLKQAEKLYRTGKTAQYDVLRAQVALGNARMAQLNRERAATQSLHKLRDMLGISSSYDIRMTGDMSYEPREFSYQELLDRALQDRLELKRLDLIRQINKEMLRIERYGKRPELNLFAVYEKKDYEENVNTEDDTMAAGINLVIPIFNGKTTSSRSKQAQAEITKTEIQRSGVERSTRLEIEKLVRDLNASTEVLDAQTRNTSLAREGLRIADLRYGSGKGTSLDVTESKSALATTETEYLRTLHGYLMSLASLAKLIGGDPRDFIE